MGIFMEYLLYSTSYFTFSVICIVLNVHVYVLWKFQCIRAVEVSMYTHSCA